MADPDYTIRSPEMIPIADDTYYREELERMDRNELQSIVSEFDADVNGQSTNEDIKDFLEGKERVE